MAHREIERLRRSYDSFNFAGAWTVCKQNRMLSVCFGLPGVTKA